MRLKNQTPPIKLEMKIIKEPFILIANDFTANLLRPFIIFTLSYFFIFLNTPNLIEASEASDLMNSGNQAFTAGNYQEAEGFF
ncbi:uncharacterized protein METZ01_LOCUS426828, partial [marine metagenome]